MPDAFGHMTYGEAVQILGLTGKVVSPESVREAYRKRAKETHPDKGGSAALFQQVKDAYEMLKHVRASADNSGWGSVFRGGVKVETVRGTYVEEAGPAATWESLGDFDAAVKKMQEKLRQAQKDSAAVSERDRVRNGAFNEAVTILRQYRDGLLSDPQLKLAEDKRRLIQIVMDKAIIAVQARVK